MRRKKTFLKFFPLAFFFACFFLFISYSFFGFNLTSAQTENEKTNEDQKNEQAEEIEDDITSTEKKRKKEEAAKAKLEQELGKIKNSAFAVSAEIKKTQDYINETENDIARKEAEIELLIKKSDLQKIFLVNLLREDYYAKRDNEIRLAVNTDDFSAMFKGSDHFSSVEEKIFEILEEIKVSKEKISGDKKELSKMKEDHEKLLDVKELQQNELLSDQKEVQLEIMEKEKMIAKLNSQLSDLRSKYSEILGKSVSTEDIVEAADFAAKAVGMNKSFLLGVLIQESNKGQFTGGCNYKESKMKSSRLEIFKDICENLGYDYKKKKVSCPPKSYKGTGGAMGVAQFMSDTWKGYESRISYLTGNKPPDPWNLVDGVTAMAIKLSNDGAKSKKRFDEAKSYCVYLAGGNWGNYCFGKDNYKKSYEGYNCWGSSIRNYGEKVLCLKDNYEKFY